MLSSYIILLAVKGVAQINQGKLCTRGAQGQCEGGKKNRNKTQFFFETGCGYILVICVQGLMLHEMRESVKCKLQTSAFLQFGSKSRGGKKGKCGGREL